MTGIRLGPREINLRGRLKVISEIRTPDMAHRSRSSRIEDAGVLRQVKFNREGVDYNVFETRPKRGQDHYRFEVRKDGQAEAYVVSFQDAGGDSGQCSCKAWIFRRQDCKHIKMCRTEFFTASTPRRAAPAPTPAARALPPVARALPVKEDQLALPGMSEVDELQKKLLDLRVSYRAKKAEVDAAQAKLNDLSRELSAIELEGNNIKDKITTLRRRGKAA